MQKAPKKLRNEETGDRFCFYYYYYLYMQKKRLQN